MSTVLRRNEQNIEPNIEQEAVRGIQSVTGCDLEQDTAPQSAQALIPAIDPKLTLYPHFSPHPNGEEGGQALSIRQQSVSSRQLPLSPSHKEQRFRNSLH